MLQAADIIAALRQQLPAEYHSAIPHLAQALTEASTGAVNAAQAAMPGLADAVRALAGREVQTNHALITFGSGNQLGAVTINDLAGRDVITLHFNLGVQQNINVSGGTVGKIVGEQINTGGGDFAEGSIDKREGTFVSGGSVQGPVVGSNQGTVNATYNYYTSPPSQRSLQEQRNRRAMLQKVKNIWIDGFLNKSLTDELRIELNLTDRPNAVFLPVNALYQERNQKPQPLPAGMSIRDVFDRAGGELLILGAPGAGKTTLLLELLRDLIQRAEQDEAHPIPVVFPLSTWAAEQKPFKDWLIDQLNVIYDVPKKIGKEWIAENEVLPLLDGLDEVAAEHRDASVEAINKYRQEVGGLAPTAVCSRIADYEALNGRLRLKGAVLVEPLTQQQVESYLARVGEPLRAVRDLVKGDHGVMELLESPLMLSVVTLAFNDASPELLRMEGTVEERRGRLWDVYIERMFTRKKKEDKDRLPQTMKWLSRLGWQMQQNEQAVYYIEHMQPHWIYSEQYRRTYYWLNSLVGGLIGVVMVLLIGSIMALLLKAQLGDSFGLPDYMMLALGGFLVGAVLSAGSYKIAPVEVYLSTKKMSISLISSGDVRESPLFMALLFILAVGFVVHAGWLSTSGAILVMILMAISLPFALLFLVAELRDIQFPAAPNQGIVYSVRSAIFVALTLWLFMGVLVSATVLLASLLSLELNPKEYYKAVGFGLMMLMLSLINGGATSIRHYTLRYLLYRQGSLPFRDLIPWLDHCVDRLFLRRVGGGYIFIHRMLMEHLAAMTDEDRSRIAGEVEKKRDRI